MSTPTPVFCPVITCIVVHWNNFPDTDACLTALASQDYPNLRVVVIDNASTDGSLARLRAAHLFAAFIPNPRNDGFPKACNLAARHPLAASADLLWLLNNDTVPPPGTASKLAETSLAQPRAGVIGAILYYAHSPGEIQAWGGGSVSRWTGYNKHYKAPARFGARSYITFASALIRRETYDQLNGLYEGTFMYFEDADFSLRARARGWQLTVAPETAILHKEAGSANPRTPRADRIVTCAGLLFLSRHAPIPLLSRFLFLFFRIAKRFIRRDFLALAAILQGARDARRIRRAAAGNPLESMPSS